MKHPNRYLLRRLFLAAVTAAVLPSCATEFYEKMEGTVDPETKKLVAVNRERYLRNSLMEDTAQESHRAELSNGVVLAEAKTKKNQQGVPKSISRGVATMYTAGQMADGVKSMNDLAKHEASEATARKAQEEGTKQLGLKLEAEEAARAAAAAGQ